MDNRPAAPKRRIPLSWSEVGFTAAVVALGLVLVIWPQFASKFLLICGGILSIATGAIKIIRFFRTQGVKRLENNDFAIGVSWAALGILVIIGRVAFSALLMYLAALVLFASAAYQAQDALRMRYMKSEKWYLHLICAAVSVAFGVIILAIPNVGFELIGVALIVEGILYAVTRVFFNRSLEDFNNSPMVR